MGHLSSVSSASFSSHDRLKCWNQVVMDKFPGCTVEHEGDHFDATLWHRPLGSLNLIRAQANQSTVSCRTGSGRDDLIKLHLQHRGFSETWQQGTCTSLATGDLALCDTRSPFSVNVSNRSDLLMLELPSTMLDKTARMSLHPGMSVPSQLPAVKRLRQFTLSLLLEYQHGDVDAEEDETLARILVDLANLALRGNHDAERRTVDSEYRRIIEWINARLTDPALSPALIAAATGYPMRTLQSLFARNGTTPREYIVQRRLDRAKALLTDPACTLSVGDVAFEVGFNDSNYFARRFRQYFGKTPSTSRYRS